MGYEVITTDGCTGFPDQIGNKDLSQCCLVHDLGGTDATLQKCLNDLDPGALWWIALVAIGVFLMKIFRPCYNYCQARGWLPKTPGSNF